MTGGIHQDITTNIPVIQQLSGSGVIFTSGVIMLLVEMLYQKFTMIVPLMYHSKKRYVRRNIRISWVKGNTEKTKNTIAKNTQCKNDTVFSVINRGRNSNNLAGSISARALTLKL